MVANKEMARSPGRGMVQVLLHVLVVSVHVEKSGNPIMFSINSALPCNTILIQYKR